MNDDELEFRVRAALQAEPPAEQLDRLEAFWRQRSRAERRRRLAGRVAAVAASVAAIGGAAVWLTPSGPHEPLVVAVQLPTPALANEPRPPLLAESSAEQRTEPAELEGNSAGRPATEYERLIFAINTRGQVQSRQTELQAAVDAAIEKLAGDPHLDAIDLANSDELNDRAVEQLLLDRLPNEDEKHQSAIVRLLTVHGTPRSTAALVALAGDDSLRPQIVRALESTMGVARFAGVVRQSRVRELRAALIMRMLTANSDAALHGFLSLVRDESLGSEALAVAESAAQPPIGPLMKLLENEDKSTRLSAAIVLGRMNGPEVTAALIELVTDRPSASAEAWIALLACRGESADRFLAAASQEPRWLGHVNNARITWARMIQ